MNTNLLLALAWMMPAMLRTWRMARFYQIEEYKTDRYWAWLTAKESRWLPQIPAIVMLVGIIVSAVFQIIGLDWLPLHMVLWLAVAFFAAQPEPIKETKKEFVRTPRAMRLTVSAMILDGLFVLSGVAMLIQTESPPSLATVAIVGFWALLLSPLALPLGNGLMYPIEAYSRKRFRNAARKKLLAADVYTIGITGSYGKTSTKVFLDHILSGKHSVYPTPKSYNTEMGVSLAINEGLEARHDYFIAEMGAYVPGEIERICTLTSPQMSLVTAVGPMHLERFGSLENIVKAKYEIVDGVPPDGVTVFNADNPYVLEMASRGHPQTRILISKEGLSEARIQAHNIQQTLGGLVFDVTDTQTGDSVQFQTPLYGQHNVTNILVATGAARHLGLSLAEIAARVKTLQPAEHRLRRNVLPNGITVIDDAYSANPVGVISALEVLALHTNGRRIVITPGMVELGHMEDDENRKLGEKLTDYATDIVLVGIQQTKALQAGIAATDFDPKNLLVVDTFEMAREWFQTEVRAGDTVLFLNDLPDTYL